MSLPKSLASSALSALGADLEQRFRNSVSRSRSRSRGRSRTRMQSTPPRMQTSDQLDGILDDPGTADTKRVEAVMDLYQDEPMVTLKANNVLQIPKDATGADAMDTRERDSAVVKGFKLCMEVANQNTTLPMYFNLAVVVPRDTTAITGTSFFRAQSGDGRTEDFDPTLLSANELHCLPINTDRYVVLKHTRTKIEPNQVVARGGQYKNIDFYMPIQKQFRWDGATSTPRKDIFVVFWASYFGRTPGTLAASNQNDTSENFSYHQRIVTYFGDPKDYQKRQPVRRSRRLRSKYNKK